MSALRRVADHAHEAGARLWLVAHQERPSNAVAQLLEAVPHETAPLPAPLALTPELGDDSTGLDVPLGRGLEFPYLAAIHDLHEPLSRRRVRATLTHGLPRAERAAIYESWKHAHDWTLRWIDDRDELLDQDAADAILALARRGDTASEIYVRIRADQTSDPELAALIAVAVLARSPTTSATPTSADSPATAPSSSGPTAARSPSRPNSAASWPPGTTNANAKPTAPPYRSSGATAADASANPPSGADWPDSTRPPRCGKTRPISGSARAPAPTAEASCCTSAPGIYGAGSTTTPHRLDRAEIRLQLCHWTCASPAASLASDTTRREVEWVTRDAGRFFPAAWRRFRDGVPDADRGGSLVDAYSRLLDDPDPHVRAKAARDWCDWEAAHVRTRADQPPDPRYEDSVFRACFARLVTHYWRHAAWLEDDALLRGVERLANVPGVLVHGRLDLSAPLDVPWSLARAWPGSELVIVDDEGHTGGSGTTAALIAATDRFADRSLARP